eukprot:SAG22_NODE_43_length_25304_cov_5.394644_15_plen_137_part_00
MPLYYGMTSLVPCLLTRVANVDDKVQGRLLVEGLLERAKMIVDAEQVHPGEHRYPDCLHIEQPAEAEDATPKEQLGITGQVKQDMDRFQAAFDERIGETDKRIQTEMKLMAAKVNAMEAKMDKMLEAVLSDSAKEV